MSGIALGAAWARTRAGLMLTLAVGLIAAGCNYGFQAGSALSGVETMAVLPFENDTDRLELTQEIYQVLQRELPGALGARQAGEDVAQALVQGTITNYNVSAPIYQADPTGGQPQVLQRQVSISVTVRIVDLRQNLIVWESTGLRAQGTYLEASETEEIGRQEAIRQLVQQVVDGAQSTW